MMKTLKVPDMHCQMCVKRISDALNGENIAFEVNLESKTVTVDEQNVEKTIDALDDLGFSVAE